MFVPVSHMHEAQVRGICWGGLFTLYRYHTLFETVCKQFINGSVPFGYSLNSGFDTGNDSWFSSGAWQVGTPVQKMPAGTGALWVGESREGEGWGTQRSRGYHFLLGLALLRKKEKKILCHLREESVHRIRGPQYSFFRRALSHAHVNIQSAWEGGAGHFKSW